MTARRDRPWSTGDHPLHTAIRPDNGVGAGPPMSATQIADLLESLAAANTALAAELDAIGARRGSLSQSTVDRLDHLVQQLGPAARIRPVLAQLDPQDLLDGAREWCRRRTDPGRPGR